MLLLLLRQMVLIRFVVHWITTDRSLTAWLQRKNSSDPTGLDDLEELERRVDAGEIINDSTSGETSSSLSPSASTSSDDPGSVNNTDNTNATSSANTINPAPTMRPRISKRGHPLPWDDEQDLEVLRLEADSTLPAWEAKANVFNQRFPENPPRSRSALYGRNRNLKRCNDTIATVQGRLNARRS